jgi:hypothetical protein
MGKTFQATVGLQPVRLGFVLGGKKRFQGFRFKAENSRLKKTLAKPILHIDLI